MKALKRRLAIVLVLCMVLTNVMPAFAEEAVELPFTVNEGVATPEDAFYEDADIEDGPGEEITAFNEEEAEEEEASPSNASLVDASSSDAKYDFIRETVVDGVKITLTAAEGVFPEEAELFAAKVEDSGTEEAIDKAIQENKSEEEAEKNVASKLQLDIKMCVAGEEIQPDTSKGPVKIAFTLDEKVNECLEVNAYHLKEDTDGKLKAENLDADVKTVDAASVSETGEIFEEANVDEDGILADGPVFDNVNSYEDTDEESDSSISAEKVTIIEAETDSFSYYVVEFTYDALQYVLPGESSVKLSEILKKLSIEGSVSEAETSRPELFSVERDETGDDWTVTAHQAFSTKEWLKVTIGEQVYEIIVTDSQDVAKIKETDVKYDTVQNAIDAAENGQTVEMIADSTENITVAKEKEITLNMNNFMLQGIGEGRTVTVEGTLHIEDNNVIKQTRHHFKVEESGLWTPSSSTQDSKDIISLSDTKTDLTPGDVVYVAGNCITGGGVEVAGSGNLTMSNVNVIGNNGSGLYISGSAEISNTRIAGNYTNEYGGGICISDSGNLTASGCYIVFNRAEKQGGGISNDGNMTISHCKVNNNKAGEDGGAIHTWSGARDASSNIKNTDILYNTAGKDGGGIHQCKGNRCHNLTVRDSNIRYNTAGGMGGGIDEHWDFVVAGKTVIEENYAGNKLNNVFIRLSNWIKVYGIIIDEGSKIYVTNEQNWGYPEVSLTPNQEIAKAQAPYFHMDDAHYYTYPQGLQIRIGKRDEKSFIYKFSQQRSVQLSDILKEFDIAGKVTSVAVVGGNFEVTKQGNDWTIKAPDSFLTAATLKVTAGGFNYDIILKDEANSAWKALQDQIDNADPECTITLETDVSKYPDEAPITINKNINLYLNGHVLDAAGSGRAIVVEDNANVWIYGGSEDNPADNSIDHCFSVNDKGLWTWDNEAASGTPIDSLSERPKAGTVVKVSGGCITGGGVKYEGPNDDSIRLNLKYVNVIGNNGSGVRVISGNVNLYDCMVAGNYTNEYGGGVCVDNNGKLTANNSKILFNRAGKQGGGISADGSFTIDGGKISYNEAGEDGGAIHTGSGDTEATSTIKGTAAITNNTAGKDGGGIHHCKGTTGHNLTIAGSAEISGNTAGGNGGGVFCNHNLTIAGSTNISNNTAGGNGGGVFCKSDNQCTIGGTVNIINNTKTGETKQSNLCIDKGVKIKFGSGEDAPGSGMKVFVSSVAVPQTNSNVDLTDDGTGVAFLKYLHSDDSNYKIISVGSKIQLSVNTYIWYFDNADSANLSEVLQDIGASATIPIENINSASSSNADIFTVIKAGSDWIVTKKKGFHSQEQISITMENGTEYEILVFDSHNTLCFTYESNSVVLEVGKKVKLSQMLPYWHLRWIMPDGAAVRVDGVWEVQWVKISNTGLFNVTKDPEGPDWTVEAIRPFTTTERFEMWYGSAHCDLVVNCVGQKEEVTYIDENGESKTHSCVILPESFSSLYPFMEDEWYAVRGSSTLSGGIKNFANKDKPSRLILTDGCDLTVEGGIDNSDDKGLIIYAQEGGTGKLSTQNTWEKHAGIGGGINQSGGKLVINGGSITATGGNDDVGSSSGAGIGGGHGGSVGEIIINGGIITATGGKKAAGIGCGSNGNGRDGSIIINGGTVTANGYTGIGGGGNTNREFMRVEIHGGDVIAHGWNAAGIGCYLDGINFSIDGGTVFATSAVQGQAGIGSNSAFDYLVRRNKGLFIVKDGMRILASLSGNLTENDRKTRQEYDDKRWRCVKIEPEYTITWKWEGNDGQMHTDTTYAVSGELPVHDSIVRENYIFTGWEPDISVATKDATYTATFVQEAGKVTVTFDSDGGSFVEPQAVEFGEKATKPSDPVKDGFVFDGWFENRDSDTRFDFNTPVNKNITLYAKWRYEHPVFWYLDNSGNLTIESSKDTELETSSSKKGSFRAADDFDRALGKTWEEYKDDIHTVTVKGSVKVKYLNNWFSGCENLTNVDLTGLDTSKAVTMQSMFASCENISRLDLSTLNFDSVTDLSRFVYMCSNLRIITWPSDINVSNVENFSNTFAYCTNLEYLDLSGFVMDKVTKPTAAFRYCLSLKEIDISCFADAMITDAEKMFEGCMKLRTIYACDTDTFASIDSATKDDMFHLCESLQGGNGTKYTSDNIGKKQAVVDKDGREGYFTLKGEEPKLFVTFDYNNGTPSKVEKVTRGSSISKPADPEYENHTFDAWYSNPELTAEYDFSKPVTKDMTLYAGWTLNSYVITWKEATESHTSLATSSAAHGEIPKYPKDTEALNKDGKLFVGWLDESGKEITPADGDKTYIAQFETKDETKYYVFFNPNGGTIEGQPDGKLVVYDAGDTVASPSEAPVRENYDFAGWCIATSSEAQRFEFGKTADQYTELMGADKHIVLYAKWTEKQFKVTWVKQVDDKEVARYIEDYKYGAIPSFKEGGETFYLDDVTGFTFSRWAPAVSAVTSDATYITVYTESLEGRHLVSFNTNGGSDIEPQLVISGKTASRPNNPRRTNYTFAGWYADAKCSTEYKFTEKVIDDIVVYAKWEPIAYTITWKNPKTGYSLSKEVPYGTYPELDSTEMSNFNNVEGFAFTGWTPEVTAVTDYATYTATYYELPKHEHVYGNPEYYWNNDFSKCTAERYCDCGNADRETVTSVVSGNLRTAAFTKPYFKTQTKIVQNGNQRGSSGGGGGGSAGGSSIITYAEKPAVTPITVAANGAQMMGTAIVSIPAAQLAKSGLAPVPGTWNKVNGMWMFTKADGNKAKNEWVLITVAGGNASYFYFDSNGNMVTGWQQVGGKWMYFNNESGSLLGACLRGPGRTPDGYEIDASGAWTGR